MDFTNEDLQTVRDFVKEMSSPHEDMPSAGTPYATPENQRTTLRHRDEAFAIGKHAASQVFIKMFSQLTFEKYMKNDNPNFTLAVMFLARAVLDGKDGKVDTLLTEAQFKALRERFPFT